MPGRRRGGHCSRADSSTRRRWKEERAEKKAKKLRDNQKDTAFANRAEKLRADDGFTTVDSKILVAAQRAFRAVLGHDTGFKQQGSRAKGTNITGSDFDYHVVPPDGRAVTADDRDRILEILKADSDIDGNVIAGESAIKIESPLGRIEFIPVGAQYHGPEVVYEQPDPYFIEDKGAQNAVRVLKHEYGHMFKSHELEKAIKHAGKTYGLDFRLDPSGRHRYEKARGHLIGTSSSYQESWYRPLPLWWSDADTIHTMEQYDEDPGYVARVKREW